MLHRILLSTVALLGITAVATAAPAGEGQQGRWQQGQRPVFGVILSIEGDQLTIEPRIPERMRERLSQQGREIPTLPSEIVLTLTSDTKYYLDMESAGLDSFAAGDEVVVLAGPASEGEGRVALKMSDVETAQRAILEGLREKKDRGGPEELRERIREHMRPVFGEITALSGDSVTIAVEIPDFVLAKMKAMGKEAPAGMPDSVTLNITGRTRFFQDNSPVDSNPFAVGDKVAVMAGPGREGEPTAWAMSDYATAEQRMNEQGRHSQRREKRSESGRGEYAGWTALSTISRRGRPVPASITNRIDRVMAEGAEREVRSDKQTPWAIMHAVVGFRSDAVVQDVETGKQVNAIEFLLTRAKHEGRSIFRVVEGRLTLPRVEEVEHHPNQCLMILSLAGVSANRSLLADDGKRYLVEDLIDAAKQGYADDQEPGWTLVALSNYLSFDDEWTADNKRTYQIADILRQAIKRDPRIEAEGGSHHLFGVSYSFRMYAQTHQKLDGVWQATQAYLADHIQTVKRFQLEDGAFSAGMLKEQANPKSPSDLAFSTGHTLEWLTFALAPEDLTQPWVERAVRRLCDEIESYPNDAFSDGAIYHAVNALRLYRAAVSSNGN